MKRALIFAATAALLAGCSSTNRAPTPTPTDFDVHGTLSLSKIAIYGTDGDPCTGSGGYSDIASGAQVKVTDNSGSVVAIGSLNSGLSHQTNSGMDGTNVCVFSFDVFNIPIRDSSIYGIEVTHRGVIQFTRDDANDISLTLG